jgi:hypothetical protein
VDIKCIFDRSCLGDVTAISIAAECVPSLYELHVVTRWGPLS